MSLTRLAANCTLLLHVSRGFPSRLGDSAIRQRWSMPGRLRLDVAPMVSNRALAQAIEGAVRDMGLATGAKANPISGSVLVTYDPTTAPVDLPAIIHSEIEACLAGLRPSRRPVAEPHRSALSRILEICRQHPAEGIGPIMITVVAYSLVTLQSLSFAAIANVACARLACWTPSRS